MTKTTTVGALVLCLAAAPLAAQGVAEISIDGDTVTAEIELVSGLGADLTISFENVVGLCASCLGLSAEAISPTDPGLLNRFPDPQLVSVPGAFPVLLQIEPAISSPLAFSGVVSLELHTHDLSYTPYSPLRLFAADAGGTFYDITSSSGAGSYRVGASKGGFSEFLIVADLRPVNEVLLAKFDALQQVLDDNLELVESSLAADLQAHLDDAWSWYELGDLAQASSAIDDLADLAKAKSGEDLPDTWRASRDLINVAGLLRQAAATLRYSLNLAASS
ncbi:MAG: DUF6689 family protein [Thermoanaerobaculia bacterium]|nr:DUF6689 family protein [Thermoanaerobaculia bacterium]